MIRRNDFASTVVRHVTSLVSVPHRARASLQQAPARLPFVFPALAAHLGSFSHRSGPLSGPGALGLRPKNYQIIAFNANILSFDVPRESATQSHDAPICPSGNGTYPG